MAKRSRIVMLLSILFAVVIAFSLSATGQGEQGKQGAATGTTAANDGPLGKYPQLVTIRMTKDTSQADDWKWEAMKGLGETVADNRYTRQITDKLNVKVVYDWVVDSSQFLTKTKVTIASGNLPDIFRVQLPDLNQLAMAGQIQEMGPSIDKYASDVTKHFNTMDGGLVMAAISVNGKVMGLPQPTASIGFNNYLWIRTDWLKKYNLAAPKTMDDLLNIMGTFVKNDPAGTGKTYSILLCKPTDNEYGGIWSTIQGFFWCYNSYPLSWMKDGKGGLVYGAILPQTKDALRVLAKMYKDGWIDPEWTVKDFDKAREIVAAGKCGVEIGYHWMTHSSLKFSRENDPNADWAAFALPPATDAKVVKARTDLGLRSTFVVKKGFKNPEAIVKMMNLYNEDNFGKNADYEYWSQPYINGKLVNDIWYFGPIDSLYDWIDVDGIDGSAAAFAGKVKPEDVKGPAKSFYNNIKNDWAWMAMFGPVDSMPGAHSAGYFMSMQVHNPDVNISPNQFVGAPTPTMVERWAQLLELRDTAVAKIITGQLDVDSGFNQFVADWKKAGGDKITAEVNDWYKANGIK
jgi:putative aldouronate transport system substrate-binding protein